MMNEAASTVTLEIGLPESPTLTRLLGSSVLLALTTSKRTNSLISKSYKQASTFFLTRRLLEAFSVLEPIVTPDQLANSSEHDHDAAAVQTTPIAGASRNTRIKVWNLYLTLLNAIIELGPDEGQSLFGHYKWRAIFAKVREGTIWEEVVQVGYKSIEGGVDADVVTCLATLLLAQSSSQAISQQRLESYLSGSSSSNLESASPLNGSLEESSSEALANSISENRTNTPQSINVRIKIIEIYVLHVLPRNEEWQYARDFISMSGILDEERKEAFLQALQALEANRDVNGGEGVLQGNQYIQDQQEVGGQGLNSTSSTEQLQRYEHKADTHVRLEDAKNRIMKIEPINKAMSASGTEAARDLTPTSKTKHAKNLTSPRPPSAVSRSDTASVYTRGLAMMAALQRLMMGATQTMPNKPMVLLKAILFLVSIALALGRRNIRDRIRGVTMRGWDKIKETGGMGVKVSYI